MIVTSLDKKCQSKVWDRTKYNTMKMEYILSKYQDLSQTSTQPSTARMPYRLANNRLYNDKSSNDKNLYKSSQLFYDKKTPYSLKKEILMNNRALKINEAVKSSKSANLQRKFGKSSQPSIIFRKPYLIKDASYNSGLSTNISNTQEDPDHNMIEQNHVQNSHIETTQDNSQDFPMDYSSYKEKHSTTDVIHESRTQDNPSQENHSQNSISARKSLYSHQIKNSKSKLNNEDKNEDGTHITYRNSYNMSSHTNDNIDIENFQIDIEEDGFIITPGKNKIYMSTFLMNCDYISHKDVIAQYPGLASIHNYSQDHFIHYKYLESQMDNRLYQLSFPSGTDLERFRRTAIHFILQQTYDWRIQLSTAHATISNIHRMLLQFVQPKGISLTTNMFLNTVFACLRMTIKHEEIPEKTQPIRHISKSMCSLLGISPTDASITLSNTTTNAAEQECLSVLLQPLVIPNAPDFLQRYLTVGRYPHVVSKMYQELASYLINLSLFSRKGLDQLAGVQPSLLAACALSLAVRVISARKDDGYEPWPQRLVVYSSYTANDLKNGIRGLSSLLRGKPEGSEILEKFHPLWASFDWK